MCMFFREILSTFTVIYHFFLNFNAVETKHAIKIKYDVLTDKSVTLPFVWKNIILLKG